MTIPTCLWCMSRDIGSLVVSYYHTLSLEPWDAFARRRADENKRLNLPAREARYRQTGRTTHALMEAVALCVRHGIRSLLVDARMSHHSSHRIIDQAMEIVYQLPIQMREVAIYQHGYGQPHVKYVDHETPTWHP